MSLSQRSLSTFYKWQIVLFTCSLPQGAWQRLNFSALFFVERISKENEPFRQQLSLVWRLSWCRRFRWPFSLQWEDASWREIPPHRSCSVTSSWPRQHPARRYVPIAWWTVTTRFQNVARSNCNKMARNVLKCVPANKLSRHFANSPRLAELRSGLAVHHRQSPVSLALLLLPAPLLSAQSLWFPLQLSTKDRSPFQKTTSKRNKHPVCFVCWRGHFISKTLWLTVSAVIFSMVAFDSSTASSSRGFIVSSSSCNLATSSAVDNSWTTKTPIFNTRFSNELRFTWSKSASLANREIHRTENSAKHLVQASLRSVSGQFHFFLLHFNQILEDAEQLEVTGRCHVIVTWQLVFVLLRTDSYRRMHLLAHSNLQGNHQISKFLAITMWNLPRFYSTLATKGIETWMLQNVNLCTYQSFENLIRGVQIWDVWKEALCNRLQGLRRPVTEPVNRATVDKSWKLSQTWSEDLSNWAGNNRNSWATASMVWMRTSNQRDLQKEHLASNLKFEMVWNRQFWKVFSSIVLWTAKRNHWPHGNDSVQVGAYSPGVAGEQVRLGRWKPRVLHHGLHRRVNLVQLVKPVNVGNITWVEYVVQILQETLRFDLEEKLQFAVTGSPVSFQWIWPSRSSAAVLLGTYLCITEEEDYWVVLQPSFHHDFLQIFSPIRHSIVLRQFNLETVKFSPEMRKLLFEQQIAPFLSTLESSTLRLREKIATFSTYMCAARRVMLCLPLPPIPSNSALPSGCLMMREMRHMCVRASMNKTSFICAVFTWL